MSACLLVSSCVPFRCGFVGGWERVGACLTKRMLIPTFRRFHEKRLHFCENILLQVLGCILFAGGLFVRFGSAILNQLISGVIKNLESALSSSGFGEVDLSSTFNISELLFGVAIGLICFGLFLVIVTVVGCCGSCYKFRVLIIIVSIHTERNN